MWRLNYPLPWKEVTPKPAQLQWHMECSGGTLQPVWSLPGALGAATVAVVCSAFFIRTNSKEMLTSSLQFTSFRKCSYSLVLARVNSVFCNLHSAMFWIVSVDNKGTIRIPDIPLPNHCTQFLCLWILGQGEISLSDVHDF